MKVYFIGSTSVGKTTLARYVSEKFKLPLLNEVARMILSERELNLDLLRTNLEIVDSFQKEIFDRQFLEEKKYDNFVSDRSFDSLAYMGQHSRILKECFEDIRLKEYIENLKKENTILFFVRPTKATLKADGVRESLNWDGVIAIDAMLKLLLEIFGLDYISINSESMQERVRIVESVLKIMKEKK